MNLRRSNFRAFTLVELILVLGIIALVAAMVAPSLRGFAAGRRTKDSAAMIVGLAQYARTAAMSEGRVYRLNFDPSARQVWLTAQSGAIFAPPQNDYGQRFTLAQGVQMDVDVAQQQDGQYVQFQPSGRTDSAHVQLTGQFGDKIEVACASATEMFRVMPAGGATP